MLSHLLYASNISMSFSHVSCFRVLARTTTCRSRRMLVRSRHSMEVSQLSVPKNLDEEPWLGELGAAHDALEIVE